MADFPSVDQIGRYLTLIALFGCAAVEATAEQRDELRAVKDLLADRTVLLEDVVRAVFDVMGEGWDPRTARGDWGPWLVELLAEREARRG